MENPFEIITSRINRLETLLLQLIANQAETTHLSLTEQQLLTVKEAASFINLAVPTLYALVSRKEIPHSKRCGRLYFSKEELRDWVEEGRQKTRSDIEAKVKIFTRISRSRSAA